ncbi:MAG: hypothetical protein JO142_01510 [Burkholderiales bacterium]|nr:hypothetical protein [Burkholderiales bacterium]
MTAVSTSRPVRQWVVWSPAFAAVLALGLGMLLLRQLAVPAWFSSSYGVIAVVLLWWLAPRMGFRIWTSTTHLHWRWGVIHHEPVRSIALGEIISAEVAALPDRPTRHVRTVSGIELNGGNFTPALNRGVLLTCQDGRRLCFGVPDPERFAETLRPLLSAPN